ncbi:hypothetical protein CBS101457_005904 [Exobasidium rhododendri]|nr:hypothetical protein CBS101457_005904 [Exobasidium rhododendri]
MAKSASHHRHYNHGRYKQQKMKKSWVQEDERSAHEKEADRLLDRQIDLPLYILLALLVSHALSGTSSLSLPYLSTHLPHSIQTLLPAWIRQLPILAPFATDLPNASHDSKQAGAAYWTTGYAGPFRSDAAGFGHPLTALHNFTRACLGLSYQIKDTSSVAGTTYLSDGMGYGSSYVDRYPWNSWTSYQTPKDVGVLEGRYRNGLKDAFFVFTGILLFTILRALTIRYVFVPLGERVVKSETMKNVGSSKQDEAVRRKWRKGRRKRVARFSEQAWTITYALFSFIFGLKVAHSEDYWMNETAIWSSWPYTNLSGLTKIYYLVQCAFWIQQVFVLNVEDRRKDHWQMFSHHIITIMLLIGSYSCHLTPVGNVILILMDPCDILLSSAKCLRYMGMQTICDVFFGLFLAAWIVTRHVFYNIMVWSCIRHVRSMESFPKPVDAYWSMGRTAIWTLAGLLCVLQCILFVWLTMIFKVAWKVISGQNAEDSRSDEESIDEEEEKEKGESIQGTTSSKGKGEGLSMKDGKAFAQQHSTTTARPESNQIKHLSHQQR